MKPTALDEYAKKRESLTQGEVDRILEKGMELALQGDLVQVLAEGGAAIFPHLSITQCGDQVAAVASAAIMACQKTGKNQILVLGVLHSLTDQLFEARKKELSGADLSNEPCRGFFGPQLPHPEILRREFSLDNFIFLVQRAAQKYGVELPKLAIRYPNLVNGKPETLQGIAEVENLAANSIVVATADLCHHGIAYGNENPFDLSEKGLAFGRRSVEENLSCLSQQDYLAYRESCLRVKSDSKDIGQVLQYLLGPLVASIYDFRLVDVRNLFDGAPQPSWVTAVLVGLKSNRALTDNRESK